MLNESKAKESQQELDKKYADKQTDRQHAWKDSYCGYVGGVRNALAK